MFSPIIRRCVPNKEQLGEVTVDIMAVFLAISSGMELDDFSTRNYKNHVLRMLRSEISQLIHERIFVCE